MTEADRLFYEPWWARLRAAYGKPQHVQNRLHKRYFAACAAHEAERSQSRADAAAALRRSDNARKMRDYRARQRAARLAQEVSHAR